MGIIVIIHFHISLKPLNYINSKYNTSPNNTFFERLVTVLLHKMAKKCPFILRKQATMCQKRH